MAYSNSIKNGFTRSEKAKNYLNFGQVCLEAHRHDLKEELVALPTLAKVRPLMYNWYEESDVVLNPAAEVVCSGTPVVVGAGAEGARVGILKYDAKPETKVTVVMEGKFLFMLDYLGDSGVPARTAANLTGLNGKKAYYIVSTGTVTDVKPTYADFNFIEIGTFFHDAELKPHRGIAGLWFAPVELKPELALAKATDNNPALPADASTAFSPTHYVAASISDFGSATVSGLQQTLTVVAGNSNPGAPITADQITWTVEGSVLEDKGFEVPATFTAGAGKTVSVSITNDGVTTVKNYTVTISATAAPASFVEV